MKDYPNVGNCLIVQSSTPNFKMWVNYPSTKPLSINTLRHNYHVIFGKFHSYEYCCKIISMLADLDIINKDYVNIREMRQDMTLRVTSVVNVKQVKDKPKIIEHVRNKRGSRYNKGINRYKILFKLFQ
ncbi:unnamed protein product [marine sediment metagenome]|uniref:Uncharacterized protein n=1 Tax=marine sediment metagenome TaxID=412755 RepID=X1DCI1_9ZZZZ